MSSVFIPPRSFTNSGLKTLSGFNKKLLKNWTDHPTTWFNWGYFFCCKAGYNMLTWIQHDLKKNNKNQTLRCSYIWTIFEIVSKKPNKDVKQKS